MNLRMRQNNHHLKDKTERKNNNMKCDNNRRVFFLLLQAGLWGKDVRLSVYNDVDYSEVNKMAEEQSVVGIIVAGIEHVIDSVIPKDFLLQLVGMTLQIEQRNSSMNVFIEELVGVMRKAGIYVLLIKGQGVAQCYERPLWRACGDVDFYLSEENYENAKQLLVPRATQVETENSESLHIGMTIGGYVVELHGTLKSGLSSRIDKGLLQIQNSIIFDGRVRSWINGKAQVFLPGADEDVVYSFTHILQHFYRGGIGIRQICDWSRLLWTYKDSLELELLESRIRKMGLMSEWKAFGAFVVNYLGMPSGAMPFYSSSGKWECKAKQICAFVMEVGNFGHNRDWSYFSKYPYLIRKLYSFGRRCGDLIRHARIFPLDSFRFFPSIVFNGIKNAAKGE